ncbi:hypothetical protein HII12_002835 [Brettanomyces bruxellensis]|uniref:DEBR0S3_04302g1_1 n=1 Tax=Dekkera bruxellensis TaxID=5007 RepID=A0A7D9H240_DEKBR|nr:hypothetical protein HII12_002835 [Brettanomyces bruxellensis]VUG18184.1 DEBR0S3_04302g1_1 [Brettanomyces bruxellensis]
MENNSNNRDKTAESNTNVILQGLASPKADHITLNNQVRKCFNTIQEYAPEELEIQSLSSRNDVKNPQSKINQNELIDRSLVDTNLTRTGVHDSNDNMPSGRNSNTDVMNIAVGIDPKKICQFCGKTFAHSGSLGRHLDFFKGKKGHPFSLISKLRANVARRGDPELVKARRREKARKYNQRDYVKAKNRARRKIMSKVYRVKESAEMKFYKSINTPTLEESPSFPRLFLFFIPSTLWPDDLPDEYQQKQLIEWLRKEVCNKNRLGMLLPYISLDRILTKVEKAFAQWMNYDNQTRQVLWNKEMRRAACDAIGQLSLFDFATRKTYAGLLADKKKQEIVSEINGGAEREKTVEEKQSEFTIGNNSIFDNSKGDQFTPSEVAEVAKAATIEE